MSEEQLPVEGGHGGERLPARRHQLPSVAQPNALHALAMDGQREADPDEIDLLAYWRILVKRRRLVAGIAAAMLVLALLATLVTRPVYRASTLMQIEKEPVPIVQTTGMMPFYDSWDPQFLTTQFELLKSRALAERVANELDIDQATLDRLNEPGWLGRIIALVRPASKAARPAVAEQPRDAAARLRAGTGVVRGGLSIEPVFDSRLVRINFDSADPALAVRVANAVAEGFIASTLERRMGATSYAKTYLEDQLKQTKAKLEDSERKLVEFAQKEGLVNTGESGTSLAAQNLTELNGALATAQNQRIRAEARWRQASTGGAMPSDMLAASNIGGLRQQQATLQADYQQRLAKFKPDYPDMQQLQRQIAEIDRQIGEEAGRIRASVKAEYDAAAAQERMLKGQIAALRGEALDTDSRSIQYNILRREADTNRQLYDGLLQRYKEVGAASDVRSNNITIIDRALGAGRIKPSLVTNLVLGLALGLLLGVLLAFVLEFLDDTLKTPEDIEQKLRLAVLGIVPKLGAKESAASAAADPRSPFSEAYRSLRTGLQFSTDHGVPRSLLVTSPSPSEGKSTTALALARDLAQLGKRVLLIDGDLRNPSLHKQVRLRADVGLSNVLAGAVGFAEAIQHTDSERLDVILAGPLPPNPAELLSGSKLPSLLTVAAERYDQVVIDGPPVLGLADAPILANAVEGTLLVVASGKTRISTAQAALKRLLAARARVIGTLITKYDAKAAGGYGYAYQYDNYYAYGGKPRLTRG